MSGRFEISESDYPMKIMSDRKGEEYVNIPDLIKWLRFINDQLDGDDKELLFTVIKSLIRFSNRKKK